MKTQKHLHLLTKEEIHILYSLPNFTAVERNHYFSLPDPIVRQLKFRDLNGNKTSTKLYFILQFGYFKSKNLFFVFKYNDIIDDITFIMQNYLPNDHLPKNLPTKKQRAKVKRNLLIYFGFQNNVKETHVLILKKIIAIAKLTINPYVVCIDIVKFLREKKIVLPSYSRLQDTIGAGLKKEEARLIRMTKKYLSKKIHLAINKLLKIEDVFYKITELKFDPKCFKKQEMTVEIGKLETCQLIFNFSKTFLPKTQISKKNIEYYADLVKLYTVNRLQKLPSGLSSFYLICYVNQRCEHILDNLVKGFIYYVDKYISNAEKYANDNLLEIQSDLEKHKEPIGRLIKLYTDDELMKLTGKKIRTEAFKIMPKDNILKISKVLLNATTTRKELKTKLICKYHKENYRSILINLRPLFLAIELSSHKELNYLLKAIEFLKIHLVEGKNLHSLTMNNCPTQHINPIKLLNYFLEPKNYKSKKQKINIYQYEFYLYKAIRENFRKHSIFVNDSVEYKDFDVDIKKRPDWEKNKTKILKKLSNKILLMPIDDILLELENLLESSITRTNMNIANGENKHFKVKKCKNGEITWTLPYSKKNDELDNPFYDTLEQTNISDVFDFVEQQCGFIKAFKHFKPKCAKSKVDYLSIKATLLANGTTQGICQFAKRSNINYKRLRITEKNYIRLDTLRSASAIIVDKLMNLPIFDLYSLDNKLHGSIDGTKKKTRRRTIKTRHSPKYFGLDVGVVSMIMTLNQVPFITEIIGANEHESHFSYPMLFNNITVIEPDIISTDTAGTNNVNDFLFYLIGKTHAACYRSIANKAKIISGFKPLSCYNELIIRPTKVVNKNLIKKKWPELLPILAALLSHETEQSIIIKKLSSHDYKSEVKEALWELNNILKSVHILKYINDQKYRQNIRAALNRGEAGNQMVNKVMNVGNGDFRGMTDLEVEIWNECTRIIILVILYYNENILSKLYEIKQEEQNEVAIEILRHISFAATQHINIGGLYSFSEVMSNIDIDNVVSKLNKILDNTLPNKK